MNPLWLLVIKYVNECQDEFIEWYKFESTIELGEEDYDYIRSLLEGMLAQMVLTYAIGKVRQ